jgi:hypothetical protein
LAPFGQGNPNVLLGARNVEIIDSKHLGKNQEHTKLSIRDESNVVKDVLHWQSKVEDHSGGVFDLAYTIKKANYRGKPQLTIEWMGFRQEETTPLILKTKKDLEVVDKRLDKVDLSEINLYAKRSGVAVFREGILLQLVPSGIDRRNTAKSKELVITTIPPDLEILAALIATVRPERVLVYDLDPHDGSLQTTITRLMGLLKFAINGKGGIANVTDLAIQCSQTEAFIRLGVDFLRARGDIGVKPNGRDEFFLYAPGQEADPRTQKQIENALFDVFQETKAFRDYIRNADLARLINNLD